MAWAYNTASNVANNGPALAGGALACTSLAFIVVCLRLYVRLLMIKAPGLDDIFIIVALIGACGYTITSVIQTKYGLGLENVDDMPVQNIATFGMVQYVGAPFYVVGLFAFKMSLLFSYLRFFSDKPYRRAAYAMMGILVPAHIAFFFVFLFGCIPVRKNWDATAPGHCVDLVPFYLTFSSLTMVFDLIVIILPFPVIIRLQFRLRKKVVLLGLFTLGIFVTVIQIIRIQTITSLSNYLDSARSIIFSIVENDVGIIIASVPTLAPLFRYFSEKTRSGTGSNTYENRYGSRYGNRYAAGGGGGSSNRYSNHPHSSSHALRTFSSAHRAGMRPLGSTHTSTVDAESNQNEDIVIHDLPHKDRSHHHHTETGSNSSTEEILGMDAITKTTEIFVTRQARMSQSVDRGGGREGEHGSRSGAENR